MTRVIHIDEIERRLFLAHGNQIRIDRSTYKGVQKNASFIDIEHGRWEARVANVLSGKGHPTGRKTRVEATCQKRFGVAHAFQAPSVKAKRTKTLIERYGVNSPLRSEAVKTKHRATCLQRYGVENPMMNAEVHAKALTKMGNSWVLPRWSDQKSIRCVGSYELAFVQWCNEHQIDFDWQVPHRMPDGRTYIVDAYLKTGEYANTWIEIKGYFRGDAFEKWRWFSGTHSNSALWTRDVLKRIGVLKERN